MTVATHTLLHSSASEEWYTPKVYTDKVREVLGTIDLDPASCTFANTRIQAARYLIKEEDGLTQPWYGSVFLNPPFGRVGKLSKMALWSQKLRQEVETGHVTEAILLANATPDCEWFHPLWKTYVCFCWKRIAFERLIASPFGGYAIERKQPTHANIFAYFGSYPERFEAVFAPIGHIHVPREQESQV